MQGKKLSRDECERFARAFIDELGAMAFGEAENTGGLSDDVAEEIRELKLHLLEPTATAGSILSAAFGVIDTYADSRWDQTISEAIAEYERQSHGSGGP